MVAVPLLVLLLFWVLSPRSYYTGTDGVEDVTYVAPTPPHVPVCVPSLNVPAQTAVVRLNVVSATPMRPTLQMALKLGGRTISSKLAPTSVAVGQVTNADFPIPQMPNHPSSSAASLCVRASGVVNWGGTALGAIGFSPPTIGGVAMPARISIWYLPHPGAKRSYSFQP